MNYESIQKKIFGIFLGIDDLMTMTHDCDPWKMTVTVALIP